MRHWLRQIIPSMFHRRLLLLLAVTLFLWTALGLQLSKLTIVEGQVRRERAEAALQSRTYIPTVRGRILDRRMRVLAVDKPAYDVAVRYPVLTGQWAYMKARGEAVRQNRSRWPELSDHERERLIAESLAAYTRQVEQFYDTLCDLGGIDRVELERRQAAVIGRVQQLSSDVWMRWLQKRSRQSEEPLTLADVAEPVGEQSIAHALLYNIDGPARLRVQRFIAEAANDASLAVWANVQVQDSTERQYPLETVTVVLDRRTLPGPLREDRSQEVRLEGVGTHLVGTLRRVWKEDFEGSGRLRPFRFVSEAGLPMTDLGGYRDMDLIGAWGVERAQESRLRGMRGEQVESLETGAIERREPAPGGDVVLSLDVQLQARIQAVMDPELGLTRRQPWHARELDGPVGEPLSAAAVVLDVAQSQVLAAVSIPSMSLRMLKESPVEIWDDKVNLPYLNRPIAMSYAPGSTVKPLVLAAAVTDRKVGVDEHIHCGGYLDSPTQHRCWIYKQYLREHGPLAGAEAMRRSCNVYFYTLGRRFGAERLVSWYGRYGLGRPTGCGLGRDELGGSLPDLARAGEPNAPGFAASEAILMAIGQGPIGWTPLQAAGAYGALARGGYLVSPTFLLVADGQNAQSASDLRLNSAGVDVALEGLFQGANDPAGTGYHIVALNRERIFNIQGVRVYGKSGTATTPPLRIDSDGDGYVTRQDKIVRQGDHAWFVGMVQREGSPRPDYVVVVIVEHAGSGGAAAGPIANQILHAMRAEGYL